MLLVINTLAIRTGRQVKVHYTESVCHWSSTPWPHRQGGRSNFVILSHCAIGHQHLGHTDRKAGQTSLYRVSVPLVINSLATQTGRQVKLRDTESLCHWSSTPWPYGQGGRSNFIIQSQCAIVHQHLGLGQIDR